jgi:hypothetical protein
VREGESKRVGGRKGVREDRGKGKGEGEGEEEER